MESIHEDNPHVFVCRLGHVAKEASGYTRQDSLRCRKIVGEQPCRKKAIIIEEEIARALYKRGWSARLGWEDQVEARHAAAAEAISREDDLDAYEA
jgi:hypothetical protein